ncbi:glycerophosphodiester phosphodiesterase family protein [Streptomyces sp. N2A]|uniref:glycerophosphodiester phosphodiesterase family protein n=1 Tax=Streptomyces sp. N2A TaxID=3073936 RepID=UPI00286FDF14|nr:glycerophosphodiester phosphodiesterase family protein [Streptomyces sp. N2A]
MAAATDAGGRSAGSNRRPLVIAHRAGTADFPENTVRAIDGALAHLADMMWLSVQVSRDGVPVLYRPADLAALTDGTGKVADHDSEQLTRLNAGYQFQDASGGHPYRQHPTPLPTLEVALRHVPRRMGVLLDMKSADTEALVPAIAKTLDALEDQGRKEWARVRFYSTEKPNLDAIAAYPHARVFEDRDTTRTRLVAARLTGACPKAPRSGTWAAFELRRDVTVTEKFTLGEGRSPVKQALMWDRTAAACFHTHPSVRTVLIGIETKGDYTTAKNLDAYAVLTDSPKYMMEMTNKAATTPR